MAPIWSSIHSFFSKKDKVTNSLICLLLVGLIGYMDYRTGFEISFSFLYMLPIGLATWYIDARFGSLTAIISVLSWTLTNRAAGQNYSVEAIRYWNAFTRLMFFAVIILLLEEFKRALMHERMISQTDFLTGIANSREFYVQASAELERAGRYKRQISLAYIDLDGFKRVNDQFGHRQGDRLLRSVAQTIKSAIRKTDHIARLGGDEFVILLPNTDSDGAKYIMDRVHRTFQNKMEELNIAVTLSAGVVSFLWLPASVDEMLQVSDRLMYEAKNKGRDKIIFLQVD